jgi:hypothetical protein
MIPSIDQLNAAKGRLRVLIHNDLSSPISPLLVSHRGLCEHQDQVGMAYLRALKEIKVWPIEKSMRKGTADEIWTRLNQFQYTPAVSGCDGCNINFKEHILVVQKSMSKFISGLCLDCVQLGATQEKHMVEECHRRGRHKRDCGTKSVRWDHGCRVRHNQPTWYYSTRAKKFYNKRLMQL